MTGHDIPCQWCNRTAHELGVGVTMVIQTKDAAEYSDVKALCSKCLLKLFGNFYSKEDVYLLSAKFLGVNPIFKKEEFEVIKNHCFYLGPFKDPFNIIYTDHIIKPLKDIGFTIRRADDIYSVGTIMEDIWEGICSASIIIAEVTGRNPNVMYEIGLSHSVGKPVVIITQDIHDVPFDLRHYRLIEYKYTPRSCKEMESTLKNTIVSIDKKRRYESK